MPSAADFISSPRLSLSLNVFIARVASSSNPSMEMERLRSTSRLAIVFLVMGGVLQTITLALTAVIASYAFMALSARVKHATEP